MLTTEVVLFKGDAYGALKHVEDDSVDVVVTSPPYYQQRDYGFAEQIGKEDSPEEYVAKLTKIFSLLRQKLSPDGVFFLNVGDKYLKSYGRAYLSLIPYRLAYALVKDGWLLLDVLIWYKPNYLPSPVKDRFASSYEPVFVFAKSETSVYVPREKVLVVPLVRTDFAHSAAFPSRLVKELLRRVDLKRVRTILDPFAGTGTTAEAAFGVVERAYLVEPVPRYASFIKTRLQGCVVKEVDVGVSAVEADPSFVKAEEEKLRNEVLSARSTFNLSKVEAKSKNGLFYVCKEDEEFLALLSLMRSKEFKEQFSEGAVFFIGRRNFSLKSLTAPLFQVGYALRNVLVVKEGEAWFPVFVFVFEKARVKLSLDALRKPLKTDFWRRATFNVGVGSLVSDPLRRRKGRVESVLSTYDDGLPKKVLVKWEDESASLEVVLRPELDALVQESVLAFCPFCGTRLSKWFSLSEDVHCKACEKKLWDDVKSVPVVKVGTDLDSNVEFDLRPTKGVRLFSLTTSPLSSLNDSKSGRSRSSCKYFELERFNWGASPAARKIVCSDYLTTTPLWNAPKQAFARFLKLCLKEKGLTPKDLVNLLGKAYAHKVGHWLREDLGSSVPTPKDVEVLQNVLGSHSFFEARSKTALKVQSVKPHAKGRTPSDFWLSEELPRLESVILKSPY